MPYTYTISCRMTEADRATLYDQAQKLELTPSDYMRYLIRIPVDVKQSGDAPNCVVVKTNALEDVEAELTKWGYHYNQAVHAMNTIALFIRRGRVDYEFFDITINKIDEQLGMVNAACEELKHSFVRIEDAVLIGGE